MKNKKKKEFNEDVSMVCATKDEAFWLEVKKESEKALNTSLDDKDKIEKIMRFHTEVLALAEDKLEDFSK